MQLELYGNKLHMSLMRCSRFGTKIFSYGLQALMINYLQLKASNLSEMIDITTHYLFTRYLHAMCRHLVSFANSLDPDIARQCIEPDLDPICSIICWNPAKWRESHFRRH